MNNPVRWNRDPRTNEWLPTILRFKVSNLLIKGASTHPMNLRRQHSFAPDSPFRSPDTKSLDGDRSPPFDLQSKLILRFDRQHDPLPLQPCHPHIPIQSMCIRQIIPHPIEKSDIESIMPVMTIIRLPWTFDRVEFLRMRVLFGSGTVFVNLTPTGLADPVLVRLRTKGVFGE